MRYHIDTIPVWDAFKQTSHCPLCALRFKIEQMDVDRCLGGSVMEPDTRIQVNEKGFCSRHHVLLYAQRNRLGHALMLHTHLKESHRRFTPLFDEAKKAAVACKEAPIGKKLTGNKDNKNTLRNAAAQLRKVTESCLLCDSIADNMARYRYTLMHLYKTDSAFRDAFAHADNLCVPDGATLLEMAPDHLSGDLLVSFTNDLAALMERSIDKLEGDLEWFTLKFDYRNQDKPWGDAKGSLERTANKLRTYSIGDEPENA